MTTTAHEHDGQPEHPGQHGQHGQVGHHGQDDRPATTAVDVVVVGGGAAGLSAATALARSRRSVVVVDAGDPRNASAAGVHNCLGQEGTAPGELLARGRAELEGYGGRVLLGAATAAERTGDGFVVTVAAGAPGTEADYTTTLSARRLVVTTGLRDDLPDVPGLTERWGRDVLHCPFCHGWEVRDQAVGVLVTGPMAVHQALMFRALSPDVTLFLHTAPPLSTADAEQLLALGVRVVVGEVVGLEVAGDSLTGLRLADGIVVARQALVVAPRFVPARPCWSRWGSRSRTCSRVPRSSVGAWLRTREGPRRCPGSGWPATSPTRWPRSSWPPGRGWWPGLRCTATS